MLVTICAFSLTACGKKEETAAYQQITDDMVTNCAEVSQSAVESLAGFDDETLNQMTANRDTFTRLAVSAWKDQENELGKYEEMGTPTTDIDREEGQVTVDIPAKFDKGDAEIKVVFNYSSDYDQMVPAYMTISEVETTGMKPLSRREFIISGFTEVTSPTKPKSFSVFLARIRPESTPLKPTAFPPFCKRRPTMSLLSFPVRTI